MKVYSFERSGDLMLVEARVWGPRKYQDVALLFDTGAAATTIEPAILEGLGYGPNDAIARTSVSTPTGRWRGHLLRVQRFEALGTGFSSFVVHALALDDAYNADGLLGMNFLENFDFAVRPVLQKIYLEQVGSPRAA
jgi:predicted aspartyl protease